MTTRKRTNDEVTRTERITDYSSRLYPDLSKECADNRHSEDNGDFDVTEDSSSEQETTRDISYDYQQRDTFSSGRTSTETACQLLQKIRERGYMHSSNNAGTNGSSFCMKSTLLVVICVLVAWFLMGGRTDKDKNRRTAEAGLEFERRLKQLMKRYTTQDRQSWLTLRTVARLLTVHNQTSEPVVVLLAATASPTLDCFARELADIALSVFGGDGSRAKHTVMDGRSLKGSNKKFLNERLRTLLSEYGVVTVLRLEELSRDSVSLLHVYADHENAPFKDAFIVLAFGGIRGDMEATDCDRLVQEELRRRWLAEGFMEDHIGPLLARVANLVVCVREQTDVSC